MLSTRTNVKCSRRDRFVGLCFFHADFGELGELRRVLRSECRGHVLHQNDGSREVACETGSDAHDRCRSARGSRQNDHRKALVTRGRRRDRKSTRLNSSHLVISYAVFCLKKKKQDCQDTNLSYLEKLISLEHRCGARLLETATSASYQ